MAPQPGWEFEVAVDGRPVGRVPLQTGETSYTVDGLRNGRRRAFSVVARRGREASAPAQVRAIPFARQSHRCGWRSFSPARPADPCWRPYADGSFFNVPLPDDPAVHPDSAAIVEKIMSMGPIPTTPLNPPPAGDYFHPIFWSSESDPVYTVHCTKYSFPCEIEGMSLRIPAAARPADGSDAHMTVIDQASGWEWDLWQVQTTPLPKGGGQIVVSHGGRTRIDGPGGGDAESASNANAAHTGNAGGIIRFEELSGAAPRIDHALFVMVGCTNGEFVYPARGAGGVCADTTDAPAIGQWLQLDMTPAEIDALPSAPWKKAILRAFATYGALVGDTGGNEAISFQLESPRAYTSFGLPNPWVRWAAQRVAAGDTGVSVSTGGDGVTRYKLDLRSEVDWASRLRVVDPSVLRRTGNAFTPASQISR